MMIGNTDSRRVMHLVPVEDLMDTLIDLQQMLQNNPDAVVALSSQGKPVMALLSWQSWEDTDAMAVSWETLEIAADPKVMANLRQSQSVGTDSLIPGDVALRQLIAEGLIDGDDFVLV